MKILSDLFIAFFKIGLFTFGGGYAMLALIEDICVEKKKWITHEEMMDITVIAESTPGPIAINLATYVGYKLRKNTGSSYRYDRHDNTLFLHCFSNLAVPGPFPGNKMGIKRFSGNQGSGCHFDNRYSS